MQTRFEATLYPAKCSSAISIEVVFADHQIQLIINDGNCCYPWSAVTVHDRLGGLAIKLDLPDGVLVELQYSSELDELLNRYHPRGGILAALEKHRGLVLSMLVLLPVILWVGYVWMVPLVAASAASKISPVMEQRLGEHALKYLDQHFFQDSQLSDADTRRVQDLWESLGINDDYRVELRAAKTLGANAVALPGGTVVLTDDLVELLMSDAELAAVIGHELGHIENDHMTTQLLQSAVLALLINWIVGDVGGFSELTLTALPTALGQLAYSRQLEAAADLHAVEFLRMRHLPPGCIGSSLRKIVATAYADDEQTDGEQKGRLINRYLSTHPYIEDRIALIGYDACELTRRRL